MSKLILLTALIHVTIISCYAQYKWTNLPNNGFSKGKYISDTTYRVEDIFFTNASTGYAVTLTNRLLKTVDSGNSWAIKNDTSYYSRFRSIEFLDDDSTGIAGTLNGNGPILRTVDAGETWTNISSSVTDTSNNGSKKICGLAHFGNNFYGVSWWGADVATFLKSADKGVTWETTYIDTNLATALVDAWFISEDTGFISGRRHNTKGPEASVILKTTDGGLNWVEVFSDTVFAGWVWKLQFVNTSVAVGAIQGRFSKDSVNIVYSTNRGNNWKIVGVINEKGKDKGSYTQACGFATPAKGWVGGYYKGIFETIDSGKTWSYENFGYDFNRIFVVDSTTIYAGGHLPYKYSPSAASTFDIHRVRDVSDKIYPVTPNPSKNIVNIQFELGAESNIVINIINIENRTVYHVASAYLAKGKHKYQWDSRNASAGNYFIWLGTDSMPLTQKFVLLK